jgi:sugar transferase (PEP-CTERM/EpsH1 system associated)
VDDLLFLSHRIPYPPTKGEKIRAWHFLERLARTYRIHLGCLIDDPADAAYVPTLRAMCADMYGATLDRRRQKLRALLRLRPGRPLTPDYFGDPGLARWVDAKLGSGTMARVFVFSSGMAGYAMGAAGRGHPARILDMVDIDSEKWTELATRATWPMRAVWAREGRTLLGFERRAALAFDRTLFVSDAECRRFSALAPESAGRTGFVENGVDLAYFDPALTFPRPFPAGARAIVFTGTMDYWPNADAMLWFAREVMPKLRARLCNVVLAVVGANPTPEVLALAASDVMVTGRVDDVRPYVAHADAVVAPLRLARGIQNKVLEGMAMGRAVVASPQAFEGVRAEPGRDLLVADGAAATADAICAVLAGAHPGLREAARAAMERGYSWDRALDRLDDIMRLDVTDPAAAPRKTMS